MRWVFVVAAVLAAVLSPVTAVADGPDTGSGVAPIGKGPTGWDSYRQLNRLPELNSGVATAQFASTDPAGENNDFWDGPQDCRRPVLGQCVLAEHVGPGEIDAIWFTSNGGDVRGVGNITVIIDGRPVLHAPLQDVVDGKIGGPFTHPLVGNADQSSGGVYIAVPMPFRAFMTVSTDSSSFYYHVTYRTFDNANAVASFDPNDPAPDVVAKLAAAGTADPKPPLPAAQTHATPVNLAPGATAELASIDGPGQVTAIRIRLPQAHSVPRTTVTDNGRAFGAGGSSTFTMKIDPRNTGIRLTRRLDPTVAGQRADIVVDGTVVAHWAPNRAPVGPAPHQQSARPSSGQWLDESVELPAAVTAGRGELTLTNAFVSSDNDFNEFTYWVDDHLDGDYQPGDSLDVGDPNSEAAHDYRIAGQTWEGTRSYAYPHTPAELAELATARQLLTGLRLRISFDGDTTVDAPLGQFFGSGLVVAPVQSLMFAMDPDSGWYSAWWPMPFGNNAQVELTNTAALAVSGAQADVTFGPDPSAAAELASGRIGYFHADSHAGATEPDQDWMYLDTTGTGKFVGNVADMIGPTSQAYLEGNERVRVDGSPTPQIDGTGTEDYYQGGWYFNRGPFSSALHGAPALATGPGECQPDSSCTTAYRLWLAEAVPFHSSIAFGIQHGGVNEIDADYSSTAFWYGP